MKTEIMIFIFLVYHSNLSEQIPSYFTEIFLIISLYHKAWVLHHKSLAQTNFGSIKSGANFGKYLISNFAAALDVCSLF